jgi:hypothetical protein
MRHVTIASILVIFLISLVTFHWTGTDVTVQHFFGSENERPGIYASSSSPTSAKETTVKSWTFEAKRDGENYGLDAEQCEGAFPKLYLEIDKSVEKRKKSPVTFEELDSRPVIQGMVRAMIYNGEVGLFWNCLPASSLKFAFLYSFTSSTLRYPRMHSVVHGPPSIRYTER